MHRNVLLALPLALLAGCTSYYNAPGPAADMSVFGVGPAAQQSLTDPSVAASFDKRPAASLPTVIAVARVQGSGYRSYSCDSYGLGRYSVVTTLDAETPEHLERLRKLPMVRDIALLNRLVIPAQLNADIDLRAAAASLHADMLFVYTFDTTFSDDDFATPLTLVTLGLFPSTVAKVSTTASGAILDTRTGYIYATATGHSKQSQLANAWTSKDAANDARLRAEREALEEMLTSIEQTWPRLVNDSPSWARAAVAAPAPQRATLTIVPVWPAAPRGNTYATVPNEGRP